MSENINKQLSRCQQDIYRLRKIEAMLARANENLRAAEQSLQSAQNKLEKERKDYDKITNKSISSIIFSILGSLDERTEKERQEALEAELKYNQYLQDAQGILEEISTLNESKEKYEYALSEYDKLYNEKFNLLMSKNSAIAQEVIELSDRVDMSTRNLREIDEAMSVGYGVQNALADAAKSLDSASSWGVWDVLGGGLIADAVKHSRIDDAGASMQRAHSLLRRFHSELADVEISETIQIDISGFAKFADFFFDGLIADWFVQSKISNAQGNVHAVQSKVQGVMNKLSELKYAEIKMQENLNEKLNKLIIEA